VTKGSEYNEKKRTTEAVKTDVGKKGTHERGKQTNPMLRVETNIRLRLVLHDPHVVARSRVVKSNPMGRRMQSHNSDVR
jgi:hypothetical protein